MGFPIVKFIILTNCREKTDGKEVRRGLLNKE